MHLELSDQQLTTLAELVDSRIKEIHPEIRRSRIHTVHDELKQDLERLEDLFEHLQQARKAGEAKEWEGYVDTRQVPCNPPPEV